MVLVITKFKKKEREKERGKLACPRLSKVFKMELKKTLARKYNVVLKFVTVCHGPPEYARPRMSH